MKFATYTCALLLLLASSLQAQNAKELQIISDKVAADVASVKGVREGTSGRPIFLLEEQHNSRELQIQSAVCLVRLYRDYGLRDIALEGYLFEDQPITTEWFTKLSHHNVNDRARIAVQLIKEGEISCAEFMALVYDTCKLHPIDKKAEYTANPGVRVEAAPKMYLVRLGETKAGEKRYEILNELRTATEAFKKGDKEGNEELREKKRADILAKLTEYYDYVIAADSWAWEAYQKLKDPNWILSERLRLLRSIEKRAEEMGVKLQDEKQAMKEYVAWLHARDLASTTMAAETAEVAQQKRSGPIGMIIGAAHTADVVHVLEQKGCSSITITPNARGKGADVADRLYERKEKGLSIFSEGVTAVLLEEFGANDKKKPRPVLMEPWFQAKAELYLFVDRLAHSMLSPPGPPGGGGQLPYGLNSGDFSGGHVSIDISRIQIVPYNRRDGHRVFQLTEASLKSLGENGLTKDEVKCLDAIKNKTYIGDETFLAVVKGLIGDKRTEENREKILTAAELNAIVFPVILKHRSQTKRKEIWVKAALNREAVSSDERDEVESMLMSALSKIGEEGILDATKIEDKGGRVQLSLDTVAAFSTSAENAINISLGI